MKESKEQDDANALKIISNVSGHAPGEAKV